MRIGVYVETVKVSQKTGISRYVIGLIEALLEASDEHTYFLYYQSSSLLSSDFEWLKHHPNVVHKPLYSPGNIADNRPRLWWDVLLPIKLKLDGIDVFHGPNHFLPKTSIPTVLTIHDLAYYYMTVHGSGLDKHLQRWTQKSMVQATHIVSVSESTKRDCIKEGIHAEKISTVYQGFDSLEDDYETTHVSPHTKPYILFIGTLQPRKNALSLVKAFTCIAEHIPHDLIMAGAKGESYAEIEQTLADSNLSHRVVFPGFISDEQKKQLYTHASCFVFPSKYEGFGLVVLEAMACGVPVIAADNSSLPEAVGNAGVLYQDDQHDNLAKAIREVLDNKEKQSLMVQAGHDHITHFSWDKCASAMLDIYRRVGTK